jgi:hypothetical protein
MRCIRRERWDHVRSHVVCCMIIEAEAAIPSGVSILLLCPRCYGVGSNVMVEQGGCVVQEYDALVIDGRWCVLCWVCGWKLTGLISSPDVVVMWGVSSGVRLHVRVHVAPV